MVQHSDIEKALGRTVFLEMMLNPLEKLLKEHMHSHSGFIDHDEGDSFLVVYPQSELAINSAVAKSFLDANSVEYETGVSSKKMESSEIGAAAKKFTLLVECSR